MALRYTTVADIRATSGITSTNLISDADLTTLGEFMEYEIERLLNTSFTPKTVIEQYNGDGTERLVLRRNPCLKVRALKIDDTNVTPEYTRLNKSSGVVWLTTSAEQSYFMSKTSEQFLTRIKYDFGQLEYTTTQVTTSAVTTAGDSVTVSVTDSSSLSADAYVEIQGMDSYQETCKISSVPDETSIVVDNLAYPHESGSVITLLQVGPAVTRLMLVASSLAGVARVVGSTFDEITGYDLGDMHVQKGEPYTQWRETATQLRKEYAELFKAIRIRPTIR